MDDFIDRYEQLCERDGLKPYSQTVGDLIGVNKGTMSAWKTKGTVPNAKTVLALANLFHVSADYLLGRTDDPIDYTDPDLTADLSGPVLDLFNGDVRRALLAKQAVDDDVAREYQGGESILQKYSRLDPRDQGRVEGYMDKLLEADKYVLRKKQA